MNWPVFGKAFLCETLYSIPFFILALFPFRNQLRFPLKNITFLIFLGQLFQSSCYLYLVEHAKPTRMTDVLCHSMPKSLLSMRKGQSVETAFPVFFHFQLYSYTARNLFFPGKLFFFRFRSHVLFASQ